jgi:hypothetical protein
MSLEMESHLKGCPLGKSPNGRVKFKSELDELQQQSGPACKVSKVIGSSTSLSMCSPGT